MEEYKKFPPLQVSAKFPICGLPIRMDTYRSCTFGCRYCFANNRVVMATDDHIQVADEGWLARKLEKVFEKGQYSAANFLDTLMRNDITFHCGGMSDPFQPYEGKLGVTKRCIDICNQYDRAILFSTKSDTVYGANITPPATHFSYRYPGPGRTLSRMCRIWNGG